VDWAVAQAGSEGATLDKAAAQKLVERVGTDTGRLAGELGKLAVAAAAYGPGAAASEGGAGKRGKGAAMAPVITAGLIDDLVGETREDDAWAFQETLVRGDAEAILGGLSRLLDNAPRDTAVLVTISMIDLARKMHALGTAAASGGNPRSLAGKLKIWPPDRAGAIIERASRASPAKLRALYHAAVEADLRQKSGLGRSHRTLERLAIRFARL
jgi:DNA polymerase III delta subunit